MQPTPHKREKTYIPAFDFVPETGHAAPIGHSLYWLRMPLKFELNHINLWLAESDTEFAIVDTGFNTPDTIAAWEGIFAEHFQRKPVDAIAITHFHPDHFGLAGWLAEKTGQTPRMTKGEFAMAQSLCPADPSTLETPYRAYFMQAGVSGALLRDLLDKRLLYRKIISTPPTRISPYGDGDRVKLGGKEWEVITGNGHCPEHACLYNAVDHVFISGDIVLPDISPNISFFPGNPPEHDPVADYLRTLDKMLQRVPDDVLVLPSHGVPFKGLHKRIAELKEHHNRRFAKLRDVMKTAGPQTALGLMEGLFAHRTLKPGDLFFALGETLAHLVHEEKAGRITAQKNAAGQVIYSLI